MIILAGDIGGTKTWLQIAEVSQGQKARPLNERFNVLFEQRFVSADYSDFENLLTAFLQAAKEQGITMPESGCIGVAGPVSTSSTGVHTAKVTNLPWQLDAQALANQFHLQQVYLINDFQAVAFGLEMLAEDELHVLQQGSVSGEAELAPKAVIGAGTGLGQAVLLRLNDKGSTGFKVIPSEGGHCDFAAGSELQRELQAYLAERQQRVTVEDVLSGRGLANIYRFLAHKHPDKINPSMDSAMREGDAGAVVGEAALSASDPLAQQAVELFVEIYGTQAGNYALSVMAKGGIYLAGGIASRLSPCFSTEIFLAAFNNKAPMQALTKDIPVKLVLNPQVGLKGAALVASGL